MFHTLTVVSLFLCTVIDFSLTVASLFLDTFFTTS